MESPEILINPSGVSTADPKSNLQTLSIAAPLHLALIICLL
jgi:hypothetical protein